MSRSSLSSWRARGRPEAKGIYFKIAVIVVFLLSLLLVACGTSSASNPVSTAAPSTQPTPAATATATQPTPAATATATPTRTPIPTVSPTPLVDDYDNNFFTSRNPQGLGLEVFETYSTDKTIMHLSNDGNKPIHWKITSIDSQNGWLSVDPLSGTAQPGNPLPPGNDILLTASNAQANLPPGPYNAKIFFKPANQTEYPERPPNGPYWADVPLTVHPLPTLFPLTAPVSGGTPIVLTSDDPNRLIVSVCFGSAIVSIPSYNGNSVTLTSPLAQNPGTVSITITVKRHDGLSMRFTLPAQFTYT